MKHQASKWLAIGGCLVIALVTVAAMASVVIQLGATLPWVIAGAVLLLLAVDANRRWRLRRLVRRFHTIHGSNKDVLVVYSDSPHWGPRIEALWTERWGHRSVFFNRSRPWRPEQAEVALWRALAGFREHTPLVIVAAPRRMPSAVRFFAAFRDHKHGKDKALLQAEAEVSAILSSIDRADA